MDNNFNRTEVRLEDICKVITKGTTPTTLKFSFMSEGVSFIKVESLDADGKVLPQKVAYITRECHEALRRSQLIENDILFSIAGALGRVGIVKEDYLPANTNQALAIIRLLNCNHTLPRYIQYYLQSPKIYSQINKFKVGVAQLNLSLEQIKDFKVILYSFKEQKRIVAKIESLFSRLDSAKDSLERTRKEIKRYRQSVLKSAFEGKLTENWRKRQKELKTGDELLGILRKGNKCQYSLLSRLNFFSIPSEWTWGFIGDITRGVEYGSSKKSSNKGKVPVIRMGNLHDGAIDWEDLKFSSDHKEIKKYRLNKGDVLFNRTNSPELVGKTAIYKGEREAIFAGYLIRINQVHQIEPAFLNYYLNSQLPKDYGSRVKTDGVNQSNINGKKLCSYPFPILSNEEQIEIVQAIESRFERAKVLEDSVEQSLTKIEQLKQSILKKAFEGKLVEPDPNDEPVEVSLARIKKEKGKKFKVGLG